MALRNFYGNLHQEHYDSYWIGVQKFDPIWKTLKNFITRALLVMIVSIVALGFILSFFGEDGAPTALFPFFMGFFLLFGSTFIVAFLLFAHPILQLFRPLRIDIHNEFIVIIFPLRAIKLQNHDISEIKVQSPANFGILVQDHLQIRSKTGRIIKIEEGLNTEGWHNFLNHLTSRSPFQIKGVESLINNPKDETKI